MIQYVIIIKELVLVIRLLTTYNGLRCNIHNIHAIYFNDYVFNLYFNSCAYKNLQTFVTEDKTYFVDL